MSKHLGVEYKVRMPQELKDKIAESAKELNRSMNADIVARLEKSFELNQLHLGMGLTNYTKPTGGIGLSNLNSQTPVLEKIATEDLMKELANRLDGFSVVAKQNSV
ncbi:Arc family DNA-binding protein [Acinetobacter chinensis]|uniref:Arc family DNA-binding protein n=1 Tax=Acinetobacter chinensis TaxID=2004650 RepID=A0A3B7LXT2_9GAMM|nr:Arc family DNA-binding protein [Acinetobacter chinensis]AXY56784.1 Arc family DNA-binding protein [Acinetobacter chinensis]